MASITNDVINVSRNSDYINSHENTPGLKSVRYVVMSYLNRKGDYSMTNYKRVMQIALEGVMELNLYHLESVKVVYLIMNEIGVIPFPSDFVDYTKIGIPVNGRIWTLTVNDDLIEPRLEKCGKQVYDSNHNKSTVDTSGYYFADHFRNGTFVGGLYGLGGGFNDAYVKIDRQKRQFLFEGNVPRSEIILEYVSSGIKQDGSTQIPLEAVEPLRRWIDMVVTENTKGASEASIARTARNYDIALDAMRHFQTCPTADEYRDILYQSLSQTIKR